MAIVVIIQHWDVYLEYCPNFVYLDESNWLQTEGLPEVAVWILWELEYKWWKFVS